MRVILLQYVSALHALMGNAGGKTVDHVIKVDKQKHASDLRRQS